MDGVVGVRSAGGCTLGRPVQDPGVPSVHKRVEQRARAVDCWFEVSWASSVGGGKRRLAIELACGRGLVLDPCLR